MSRMDCGLRRNDEAGGTLLGFSVRSPPVVPPLRRGDVDSRFRGNDEG